MFPYSPLSILFIGLTVGSPSTALLSLFFTAAHGLGLLFLIVLRLGGVFGSLELSLNGRIRRNYGAVFIDGLGRIELSLGCGYVIGQVLKALVIASLAHIGFKGYGRRLFDVDVDFEQALPRQGDVDA